MEHQDWKQVILKPKVQSAQKGDIKLKHVPTWTVSGATNQPAWKIEKQVDSDSGTPINVVPSEVSKEIIKLRLEARLTQKDLARLVNIDQKEIQKVEGGTAIYNKQQISKIRDTLQRRLKAANNISKS